MLCGNLRVKEPTQSRVGDFATFFPCILVFENAHLSTVLVYFHSSVASVDAGDVVSRLLRADRCSKVYVPVSLCEPKHLRRHTRCPSSR